VQPAMVSTNGAASGAPRKRNTEAAHTRVQRGP